MEILLRGEKRHYEGAKSAMDIAADISEGLARMALACKVNDVVSDLSTVIDRDCEIEFLTFNDDEGKRVYRHTCSHILAQAVKKLYPNTKLAIGPAIENGFYYDFEFATPLNTDDLAKIEKEMSEIIKAKLPLKRFTLKRDEAIKLMTSLNAPYKIELINDLPEGEELSFYQQGDFVDLCAGAHLPHTGLVKAFKLTSLTGAYWRGSEKNKMLTRIYGVAFDKKSVLDEYLDRMEQAKLRDHNKIGRELNYFMTDEHIGQGLPLLMPKGARFIQRLQRFVENEEEKRGYWLTKTPLMAKSDLYKISGHWDHYLDGMFVIGDEQKGEEVFALRPMTCPFQYTIYNNGLKSYKDLPCRYGETSTLFRNEASGEMHGLIRVRQFTISEGHLVVTPAQLEDEFKGCLELAKYMLTCVGLIEDVSFRLSKWDPKNTEKYINEPETWAKAEDTMASILDHLGVKYSIGIGEAAFYGPKLDIQIRNVWGKEDTLITIQVDMFLAKNFDMNYIDENGEKKHPYIIHRTSIGCYERTLALLLEKYAGALPLWLAPIQVKILSLTDRTRDYANAIAEKLRMAGIFIEIDSRSETVGYKIRAAQLEKVPYMLIVGDKEADSNTVSVRSRLDGDLGAMNMDDLIARLKHEIATFRVK